MKNTLIILAIIILLVIAGDFSSRWIFDGGKTEFSSFRERYLEVSKIATDLIIKENPGRALSAVKAISEKEKLGLAFCHSIGHEIGNAAVDKYTGLAEPLSYIPYAGDYCGGGYVHGVFEQYIGASDDPAATIKDECYQYEYGELNWLFRPCIHGAGHGFMAFTDNDMTKSLEMCETVFSTDLQDCIGGVYMENFNASLRIGHPTKYTREDDLFYPCQEQIKNYQGQCYFYAVDNYLNRNPGDYAGLLEWCLSNGDESAQLTCVDGAGQRILQNNIHDPIIAEKICENGAGQYLRTCIRGLALGYKSFYISEQNKLDEFCDTILSSKYRQFCPGYRFQQK